MCAKPATRLKHLHRYVFSDLDAAIARERARGRTIVDLAKSDPTSPPESSVPKALADRAMLPDAHLYPPYRGEAALRRAFARWYQEHYDAPCSEEHVLILSGSKSGLAHLPLCFIDPGDAALVPDPSYPTYVAGVALAGGEVVPVPLHQENDYLPEYRDIGTDAASRARLLYLNYPHNPTGAVATDHFLEETAEFIRRYDLVTCYDLAYARIVHEGRIPALSLRSVAGAQSRTIEFFTFSKTYSMQGYRLAAAVANPELLNHFALVQENISAGIFPAVQSAGLAALDAHTDAWVEKSSSLYRRRQEKLFEVLRELGGELGLPSATVYLWLHAPRGLSGDEFAQELLRMAGIAVTPGLAFGHEGTHFVRISLTATDQSVEEACQRLRACYPKGLRHEAERVQSRG